MNKLIVAIFLVICVGVAMAGYGAGTPNYYDPWTYYGGYDRYYNRNNRYDGYDRYYNRYDPRYFSAVSRRGGVSTRGGSQPRPFNPTRYNSGGQTRYSKVNYYRDMDDYYDY